MGGNKVLQHVQAFAEVGGNGRLNDGAIRLGHQTAHTCQLANLRGRATRARVGHHVDGIERLLVNFFAMAVGGFFNRQLRHHDLGDFVTSFAPNINHFVVALTRSHQTSCVLVANFFHFGFTAVNDACLFSWHQHVVHTNRNTCFGSQTETVLQQLIGEDNRFF